MPETPLPKLERSKDSNTAISIPRSWKWLSFCLAIAIIALSPMAVMGAFFPISLIMNDKASIGQFAFSLVTLTLPISWLFFCIRAWKTIAFRNQPIAIVRPRGINLPHMKPAYLAWSEIASVEQVVLRSKKYLRLRLLEPQRYISNLQRISNWPFGDSILVVLDYADRTSTAHEGYIIVKQFHDDALADR
jgi:hypothetical protein